MMVKESQHIGSNQAVVAGIRKNGSLDRTLHKNRHHRTGSGTISGKAPNICEVIIVKVARKGLGIGLASFGTLGRFDYGIYVKYIAKGSPAATHGELRLKDVLLSINKESLDDKSVDDIYRLLRNLLPGPVNLLVKRSPHSIDSGDKEGNANTSIISSKQEIKEGMAALMAPALPSKGRPTSGILKYSKESDQGGGTIPLSSALRRSSPADVKKEMLNKQNWFVESSDGKKHIPATKGSLGIDYGKNVNSTRDFNKTIKKRKTDENLRHISDDDAITPCLDGRKGRDGKVKPIRSKVNNGVNNHLPDQTTMASILVPVKGDKLSGISLVKGDGKKSNVNLSLCNVNEVPEGMEPHFVEIVKDDKTSLGISLVPATGKCTGLFLIRFIFPGTAASNNGNVFCGDCIFSVNSIKLINMSHPQAIHLLKKCTIKCKLIIFRKKKEKTSKNKKGKNNEIDLQTDIIPGTITEINTEVNSRPVHSKIFKSKFHPGTETSNDYKDKSKLSDGDETEDEPSQIENVDNVIPQYNCVNKRTKLGPFMIEHEKKGKSLGINVMMDEYGYCNITDISPNGSIVNDKKIRVGDILIAVNNQLVSGKPISDVKSIIRNIPKGLVRLILKTSDTDSEYSHSSKSSRRNSLSGKEKRDNDTISINSSSDDQSEHLSTSSLVLPPDNSKSSLAVTASLCKNQLPSYFDAGAMQHFSPDRTSFRDDMSDMVSLPPAPPRPYVPQKLLDSFHDSFPNNNNAFDNMSDVASLPPAPPRPVHPGNLLNQLEQCNINDSSEESDMESMFSCIPAPPPPVSKTLDKSGKTISGTSLILEGNNDIGFNEAENEKDGHLNKKVYAETPLSMLAKTRSLSNGSHKDITSNYSEDDEEESRRRSVIDYLENNTNETQRKNKDHENRSNNDEDTKKNEEDEEFTPAIFDIKQILDSPAGSNRHSRTTSFSSHESVSVYPEGIVVYNENKKKTLFSKLKSKILLPSKGNAKEYTSPSKDDTTNTKENVKQSKEKKKNKQRPASSLDFYDPPTASPGNKKKKKRPLSALGFSDGSTRSTLKASISQPDLTNLTSHEVDLIFRNKGSESPGLKSVEDWLADPSKQNHDATVVHLSNDSSLSSKSLPRILPGNPKDIYPQTSSEKKCKEVNGEKKNRKRNSYAPSVSPPRTPPPPPPSEFIREDDVDISNENNASCSNDYIPSSEVDIGYPEKILAGYNIPLGEQHCGGKSMSESSSSIPGSYAAYGPTITSANVSMDNLDATYDVIDGKPVLNTTYEVNANNKPIDITYDVYESDPVGVPNGIDIEDGGIYESVEDIKPKLPPKPACLEITTCYSEPVIPDHHTPTAFQEDHYPAEEQFINEQPPNDQTFEITNGMENRCPPTLNPSLSISTQPPSNKRLPSLLSDKDKYDPKLQPFIMTQGVSALLRTWPSDPSKSKTCSSPYSDYDDDGWGSEFSSNVLDYSSTPDSQARRPSLLNSFDNSGEATYSIEESSPGVANSSKCKTEPSPPQSITPKPKGRDFRHFFSRGNKSENREDLGDKRLGRKEKRKQVKSGTLPENDGTVEMSSAPKIESEGKQTCTVDAHEIGVFDAKAIKSNIKASGDSLKTRKNPIAKPPRRRSQDTMSNVSCSGDYENLQNYIKSGSDEVPQFRPVPPFLDGDGETPEKRKPLSKEEHNQLYAAIDYSAKANRKLVFNNTGNNDQCASIDNGVSPTRGRDNLEYEDYGYDSDGTVYTIPERNNSPGFSPEPKPVSDYSTIEEINNENEFVSFDKSHYEEVNISVLENKERHDEIFAVELRKEHGKCLGISLIGGSDTPIVKNLIKSVDEGSVASKCRIPLEPGDEIIEVNDQMVIGFTHSQILRTIRESPPLLKFQLHRSADRNIDLLREQQISEMVMNRKIDSEKIIANLTASCHNTKGTEIVPLDCSFENNEDNDSDNALSVESFELKKKKDEPCNLSDTLPRTSTSHNGRPAYLPPTGNKVNRPTTPTHTNHPGNENRSNTPTRNGITSDCPDPNVINVLEIELHKEAGRGLGISVVGGPKLVIKNGIKVKRLSPNSIAYIDGRLQKDDHIVAINGNAIKGMTQGEALNMLQNIKTTVILTVHRTISLHGGQNNSETKMNVRQSDIDSRPETGRPDQPVVGILKKSNSDACLPKDAKSTDKKDDNGRKSRPETKNAHEGRSRSENRELKRKPSTRSRSRSPGIFSRIFRGSERSLKGNISSKDKSSSRKNSEVELGHPGNDVTDDVNRPVQPSPPFTLNFEKTSSSLDFTLTRNGKMYGDSPTVVQSTRKGSALSKSLFMGDIVLSINGVSIHEFSDTELKKFLRSLPKGTIPMVIQRN